MIDKHLVNSLVGDFLKDHADLFLVDLQISTSGKIGVYLDGDNGVPVSVCIDLSRFIESKLDRGQEDFELEVSSVGVSKPLILPRQFVKNVGRDIKFESKEEQLNLEGTLKSADQTSFSVELRPEKKGKKKTTKHEHIRTFSYQDVDSVIVQVSFKKNK